MEPQPGTHDVQCAVCHTPLKPDAERCPACDYARPDGGWPVHESVDADRLFGVDADPYSPVALQLPRAVAPRVADGRIELGAPPSLPLAPDDPEEELLEFGEDSDPVGFVLAPEAPGPAAAPPRALRVRVVPAEGDQRDEPDVVVPLAAQVEAPSAPLERGLPLQRGAIYASRYRVDEVLEAHGTYRSYLAVQEPMVRRVQLTVLGELGGGETQQEVEACFLREAALVARRSHPNLGSVVDFGRAADGSCYLATELIYGFSFSELMGRGPVEPERLAGILLDVARGLAVCHDAGVVHRALWPAHVVLENGPGSADSLARLAGYGFGQVSAMLDDPPSPALAGALAPEVVQGGEASPASDVYAFGALAAAGLLGRPLFEGGPDQVLRAQVERDPVDLEPLVHGGGPAAALVALALECLAKDPAARPADGAALVPRLEALAGAALRPVVVGAGLSWRVLFAAALAGALLPTAVLAVGGLWMMSRPEQPSADPQQVVTTLSPDLAEVVEAQASAQVRSEVATLREQIEALETALTDAVITAEQAREEEAAALAAASAARPVRSPARASSPRPRVTPIPPPPPVEPEPVAAPPEPEPVVEPPELPAPVVAALAAVQSEPEPEPPPPPPHPAAASLDGLWLGSAGARDLALDLKVAPDGSVRGSARLKRGGVVESAKVRGQVSEVEGAFQLELQVTEAGETTSYSGRLEDGAIQGRVAQGGRTRGRWKVAR